MRFANVAASFRYSLNEVTSHKFGDYDLTFYCLPKLLKDGGVITVAETSNTLQNPGGIHPFPNTIRLHPEFFYQYDDPTNPHGKSTAITTSSGVADSLAHSLKLYRADLAVNKGKTSPPLVPQSSMQGVKDTRDCFRRIVNPSK